jgi:hypothetical protein
MLGLFAGALIMALPFVSSGATITLQEGVDGYSGCSDSYIGYGGYGAFREQNFGTAPNMLYGQESYQNN